MVEINGRGRHGGLPLPWTSTILNDSQPFLTAPQAPLLAPAALLLMNKKLLLTFILLLTISGLSARTFRHPGLLHSSEAIERTRQWVKHENPVAMGSYRKLIADPKASASYQMAGPFDIIARDGQHGRTKGPSENDFLAAYYNALRYVITGEEAHAATAMKIIRAYASRLQAIDGHDGPL